MIKFRSEMMGFSGPLSPLFGSDRLALKALQGEPGLLTALLGGSALLGCKNHGRNSCFLRGND